MDEILERFVEATPVAVMVPASIRRIFSDAALDELFERHARTQYTRELTFSTVTRLMRQVATRKWPSLHAAYRHAPEPVPVSITALYDKVNGLETGVSQALVQETAQSVHAVVQALPGPRRPRVAGLRLRTLDGNFLAGTDRRLDCLRGWGAAALPGRALVVRDGATGLLTDLIPCEDAYPNERSLCPAILALAAAEDLWLADRNCCTLDYLAGLAERRASFVIRHHASIGLQPLGRRKACASNASGRLYEQRVRLSNGFEWRCITVALYQPLRDGSTELRILTNVPARRLSAKRAAKLYALRWQIETAFGEWTVNLRCAVTTLGHPKAALFAFARAVAAYNILVVVRAALAGAEATTPAQREQAEARVSSYPLAQEVTATTAGLLIAVPPSSWERLIQMPGAAFAAWLAQVAAGAPQERYRKSPRGPKKPSRVRRTCRGAHRSTARLLAQEHQ